MAEEIKFEKALERLAKIVEDLESGNIALEDAIKKYEEGVKLSRTCQEQLAKAEKKIEVLTRSLDGEFTKKPFEYEENEEEIKPPAKGNKKTAPATESTGDDEEDLLF